MRAGCRVADPLLWGACDRLSWRCRPAVVMRKEYAKLRRRPFLMPVWLMGLVAVLGLAAAVWAVVSASTTTFFVIRHAEAAAEGGMDPPLSLAGELRAVGLVEVFGSAARGLRVDGIIVSGMRRSQDTARPLAAALGVPVITVESGDPDEVARRAREDFAGGHVLIVGHSNTVPDIVRELSGQKVPPMLETDYSTLYIVARPHFSRANVAAIRLP